MQKQDNTMHQFDAIFPTKKGRKFIDECDKLEV